MLDADGLVALSLQLVEQFGYAFLEVVGNLVAALLPREVRAQRLNVVVQQFVGVLVDVEEPPAQIDSNILFHHKLRLYFTLL